MVRNESWLETAARAGYLAKGAIYLLVGILAAMWAFGEGGQVSGGKGVVYMLAQQPGGSVILGLLAIGLAGFALWRFVQAGLDPENEGSDGKGAVKRFGRGLSGIAYGFLAFTCVQALGLSGSSGGGGGQKTYLAEVLGTSGGQILVIAFGVFVIGVGLYQLYKAYTAKFVEKLKTAEMSPTERTWTIRLGRLGHAARGVTFPIIGFFLIQAGLASSASQAKDLGGALREISQQSYGTILLALVAIGLAAYGVYMVAAARYRRIPA